jgi:hypothetical protein
MKELKKIESSLEKLHKDFNSQLQALSTDSKEFHNSIIDISTKYPEYKELLQFMVFINDKLETNQNMFSEVVIDSFNELVKVKKDLVQEIITGKEVIGKYSEDGTPKSFWSNFLSKFKTFKDIKIALTTISISLIALSALFVPDKLLEILAALIKMFL